MRAYRVTDYSSTRLPTHVATLDECRAIVRSRPTAARRQVEVAELEVPTDKAGLVALLNGVAAPEVLRRWQGTARGGLKVLDSET